MGLGRRLRVTDNLGQAIAVTKVDKNQAAVIAVAVHPPLEDRSLADGPSG
jgi:hypothetical protein